MKIQIKNSYRIEKFYNVSFANFLDVFGKRKRASVDAVSCKK